MENLPKQHYQTFNHINGLPRQETTEDTQAFKEGKKFFSNSDMDRKNWPG